MKHIYKFRKWKKRKKQSNGFQISMFGVGFLLL